MPVKADAISPTTRDSRPGDPWVGPSVDSRAFIVLISCRFRVMRDEHRFLVLCSSYVWMLRELHVSGIAPRIVLVTDETRTARSSSWCSLWMSASARAVITKFQGRALE